MLVTRHKSHCVHTLIQGDLVIIKVQFHFRRKEAKKRKRMFGFPLPRARYCRLLFLSFFEKKRKNVHA